MAALIHHHCHHPAPSSATVFPSSNLQICAAHHRLKQFTPAQVNSYLSPSKHTLSLYSSKPHLLLNPSSPLSKTPSFEHPSTPNRPETIERLSNHDLSRLLKLSIQYSDNQFAKALHASVLKIQEDTRLFNTLITSYLELGHLDYAKKVFVSILRPDVVSYTAMISGLTKSNFENEAVVLFFEMREVDIEPNEFTFVAILTVCMRLLDLELGSQVHAFSIKTGHVNCGYVSNALMGLYGKCGCLDFVFKLFSDMTDRDIASWNTVISCMVKEGVYDRAFELFQDMLSSEECGVDYFTLSSLLVACARCFELGKGKEIHAYAHKTGYGGNLSVNNALIEFYSKCGCLRDVETLFLRMPVRDDFTWTEMINSYMGFGRVDLAMDIFDRMPEKNCVSYNSLLAGFCQNNEGLQALGLFCRMVEEGVEVSDSTLTSILNACGLIMNWRISRQVHAFITKFGFGSNDRIETALLNMYARCCRMDDAEKIFHRLPQKKSSPILMTSMICGYARNSEPEKAISLSCRWQFEEPNMMDEVALASILGVCGEMGFLKLGEQFHCYALKYGFLSDIGVGNAIVSMYSKSGDMAQAVKIFDSMPAHDIVSWNSLFAGYVLNRHGEDALDVWKTMQSRGIHPDAVTCISIISAYQHTRSNLLDQCRIFFLSMKPTYQIEPDSDHYARLVSVLGYWGLLNEAEEIIDNMPFEPKASVWRALLDSCRARMNATIGRRAAKKILSMVPQDSSMYILKSNLYSASGRWHCSDLVREEMKERGFRKFPGRSWIIHQNKVHSFFARDKSHMQAKDIYSALDILYLECLKAGYVPDTSFVLHEVEEHQKINFLLNHSGKLAATYGLLMSRPGKPVRVMKNINLCGDCHSFLKNVSIVTKREIHVRDASGFHCFADGECSCKDYW